MVSGIAVVAARANFCIGMGGEAERLVKQFLYIQIIKLSKIATNEPITKPI